ncbi:hypothetical protein CJ232_05100 [Hoylesella timonensis]|uniref:Uncharacterized protein n=1 Tax=Hoylesella timonensis TaxID=386414 RepID=A0A2N6Q688_9BACT|nr:hypothetical protein CJ232_05100 [Hoylesella timonensis]
MPEFAKAKFLLCNDSASRNQRKFTYFGEAQPILCKDSASRNQKKFTYFGEAQPILCKFTVICEDIQINKKLFTDVFLPVSLICINKTG